MLALNADQTMKQIYPWLFCILGLNLLQAGLSELSGDEALYWLHAQNLDWGFRDHPPLIGAMIFAGDSILHHELGVRLLVVFFNLITLLVLYKLSAPRNILHFFLLALSIPVFQLYGFIATPDAPLLLSAVLYLFCWKNFIEDPSIPRSLLLGTTMAFMMWSKYHGLFIILFTLLPLKKYWFHPRFWMAALTGILLFSPHLIWQIVNDLPTVKFHLNDRNSDTWEWRHILGYVGGQFAVFNPLVFLLVLFLLLRTKAQSDFERSLRWMISGMLLLFFFNSFRGRVEPHWTAPLTIAIIPLVIAYWNQTPPGKAVTKGLIGFVALITVVRAALIIDFLPPLRKEFHRAKNKMHEIAELAGDKAVCFENSYQNPSWYMFYTGKKAHSINNIEGGKNQFDFWHYGKYIHHQPCILISSYGREDFHHYDSEKVHFTYQEYDDLPVLHHLKLWADEWLHHYQPGDSAHIAATFINENLYPISFADSTHTIHWIGYFNHKKQNDVKVDLSFSSYPQELAPGEEFKTIVSFLVPDISGKNYLFFGAQVDDLSPTYQSNKMRVMIGGEEEN